jgi:monoamine oxidase
VELAIELPREKKTSIAELGYGTSAKLIGGFATRFWRSIGSGTGDAYSDNGVQLVWDSSRGQPAASGILTNLLAGKAGATAGAGSAEERFRASLALMEQIFPGASAAYTKDSAVRMHWPSYALTKGSYSCYRPGQTGWSKVIGERAGNVHFAGEHTSLRAQGYMEGACESGARAAEEILKDLGRKVAST